MADNFLDRLERLLGHIDAPLPPGPEPYVHAGPDVDQVLFADGGLLTIPAELRLFRYAD